MSLSFATGGAAGAVKPPPVTGSARCTLNSGVLTFEPGLRYKDHISGIQKGRGASNGTLTANLTGCTNAALEPAPGVIDHGTLQAGTRVAGSYCNLSNGIKIRRPRIDWFTADNAVIGRSWLKMVMSIAPGSDSWYAPATVSATATTLKRSSVFPLGTAGFTRATLQPTWLISVNCFKDELTTLGLAEGPITIEAPAP